MRIVTSIKKNNLYKSLFLKTSWIINTFLLIIIITTPKCSNKMDILFNENIKKRGNTVVITAELAGNIDFYISGGFTPLFNNVIAGTEARGGGEVINDSASPITDRGLCWNTTGNPTLSDQYTSDGSGEGVFTTAMMSGLTENTIYYVRAYAVNSTGTIYGNEISFNSGLAFGTSHQGGLVFYNDGFGGGLVAESSDNIENIWSNQVTSINTTSELVGEGQANTTAIIGQSGHTTSMAQDCDNLIFSGYSDWFFPSRFELVLVYHHLIVPGHSTFTRTYYWSSSEASATHAYRVDFTDGSSASTHKSNARMTRAVRAF